MDTINNTFFELVRIAVGTQENISRQLKNEEWCELYKIAAKQSLLGICFAALQRLGADTNEGLCRIGMTELQYLKWMGLAVKIQQKNELLNKQCVELQSKLSSNGIQSCILKGQGVGVLYSDNLSELRQCGDIDLWVDGGPEETIARLSKIGIKLNNINIKHADAIVFEGTEVEIHFVPSWFYNPRASKRFKLWVRLQINEQMSHRYNELVTPTVEFNAVYLLLHIYRHLLDEGVGMRQFMDYYFALKSLSSSQRIMGYETIRFLGMEKIASAVMWIMREVFFLEREYLLCAPDSKEGKMLLNEVMTAGNFGHYGRRNNNYHKSPLGRGLENFCRNLRFLTRYPSEVICAPFWKLWHWHWKKRFNRL